MTVVQQHLPVVYARAHEVWGARGWMGIFFNGCMRLSGMRALVRCVGDRCVGVTATGFLAVESRFFHFVISQRA